MKITGHKTDRRNRRLATEGLTAMMGCGLWIEENRLGREKQAKVVRPFEIVERALKIQCQSRAPSGSGVASLRPLEAVELVEVSQRLENLEAGCPVISIVRQSCPLTSDPGGIGHGTDSLEDFEGTS